MTRIMRWGLLCALATTLLAPVSGAIAAAKPAAVPPNIIGVVDQEMVMTGFTGYQAAMARYQAFGESRKSYYYALRDGIGLPEKEFEQYKTLINASKPTDAEKKDIDALKAQAKGVMDEYEKLQQNQQPTDAEKKRKDELEKIVQPSTQFAQNEGQRLSNEMQMESNKYSQILNALVEKGIAAVARDKKLAIVLNRNLPAGEQGGQERLVLWGGTDITPDVIETLNKTFKESMLDAPQPVGMPGGATP